MKGKKRLAEILQDGAVLVSKNNETKYFYTEAGNFIKLNDEDFVEALEDGVFMLHAQNHTPLFMSKVIDFEKIVESGHCLNLPKEDLYDVAFLASTQMAMRKERGIDYNDIVWTKARLDAEYQDIDEQKMTN